MHRIALLTNIDVVCIVLICCITILMAMGKNDFLHYLLYILVFQYVCSVAILKKRKKK